MSLINVVASLRTVGYAAARSPTRNIAAVIRGTLGPLKRAGQLDDLEDPLAIANQVISEATNYRKLRSVNFDARPNPGTTMLPKEIKTGENFSYTVSYKFTNDDGSVSNGGITVYSDERLTKRGAIEAAREEVMLSQGQGLRSGISIDSTAQDFELAGAYFNPQ